jgi:hypothetical protein
MLSAEPDIQLAALPSGLSAWSTFEIVQAVQRVSSGPKATSKYEHLYRGGSHVHHGSQDPMKEDKTMTTPTDIDRDAPVIADHEIDITAPLDTVWVAAYAGERLAQLESGDERHQPGGPVRGRQLVHVDQLRLHRHVHHLRGR